MCIACRKKSGQKSMLRLKCEDSELKLYNKSGRSFYLCSECTDNLENNEKSIQKNISKICKRKDDYIKTIKELLLNVG
jgi:predicted RNA-binding protein YlxR (DUF448 family)